MNPLSAPLSVNNANSPQGKIARARPKPPTLFPPNVYRGFIDFEKEILERERFGDECRESGIAPSSAHPAENPRCHAHY